MMGFRLIIIFLLITQLITAQRDKRSVPYSIRGSIGIPKSLSSEQFKTAFNGVYQANLSVNARAFSTFYIGLGYQNTHFQNNKGVFAFIQNTQGGVPTGGYINYNTRLQCHGAFLKLGYDQFFGKGFVSYSINTGMMFCQYQNVVADSSKDNAPFPGPKFTTPYLEPELAVHFLTDGSLTFSLLFSYGTMLTTFDPKMPRFNHLGQIKGIPNHYFISWLNIGFGFSIMLGK